MRTPPPPEHRVWRHPSELAGTVSLTVSGQSTISARRRETLLATGAGLVGAVAAGALLMLLLPGSSNAPTFVAPAASAIPRVETMAVATTTTSAPPSTSVALAVVTPPEPAITRAQLAHNGATAVPLLSTGLWLTTSKGMGDATGAVELTWGTSGPFLATAVAGGDGFTVLQLDRQLSDVTGLELAEDAPLAGSWVTVLTSDSRRGVVVARDGGLALAGVASHSADLEGAPVLDQQGRLVGLCSNDRGTTTLIPVTDVVRAIDSRQLPPWVGIAATTSIEEGEPFTLITEVAQAGPAAQAGIRVGDVIVGFGADSIDTVVRLTQVLEGYRPGDTVVVTVLRDTALVNTTVTLVPRPFSL